jgi:signal transduction histidine kinase
MVFTAVEQRRVQRSTLTENDTVVALAHDLPAIIENIQQVLPDTKTVAVVNGDSPGEKLWLEDIRKEFAPFTDRLSFIWYNDRSFADILKHAAALPRNSAIFWHLMNVDAAGVVHESDALARLYAVANAPIFTYDGAYFGREIVGGPMHSVLNLSRLAANAAVRILGGEKAGDIKVPPSRFAPPIYDWRQMQRWGIGVSRLPPNSEIRFRPPTLWEQYRWQVTAVLVALLVQAVMIAWLLLERYGRRKAEFESRQRSLEVMHLNRTAEVGALSASFAHEVSQPLVAISLNAVRAKDLLKADAPEVGKLKEVLTAITRANDLAVDVIRNLRNLLKRKSDIQDCDLDATIADAVHLLSPEANRREIELRVSGTEQPLLVRADPVHLQQVVLNLVSNAMDAMPDSVLDVRKITIQTSLAGESTAEVSVSDSGPGIPEDRLGEIFGTFYTTKEQGTGLGLSVARTIIETYDGKIWAEINAEGGALFRFTLPLLQTQYDRTARTCDHQTTAAARLPHLCALSIEDTIDGATSR